MSLESTLKTYGQIGVKVLRDAVAPLTANGKTLLSIRFESDLLSLRFYGRQFFELLEKGRRPTTKKPSPEMIANLTEYAEARGMENPKSAAWAIAKTLNKEGDKTFRAGGRVVYSGVMDTFAQDLKKSLAEDFKKTITLELKKTFK